MPPPFGRFFFPWKIARIVFLFWVFFFSFSSPIIINIIISSSLSSSSSPSTSPSTSSLSSSYSLLHRHHPYCHSGIAFSQGPILTPNPLFTSPPATTHNAIAIEMTALAPTRTLMETTTAAAEISATASVPAIVNQLLDARVVDRLRRGAVSVLIECIHLVERTSDGAAGLGPLSTTTTTAAAVAPAAAVTVTAAAATTTTTTTPEPASLFAPTSVGQPPEFDGFYTPRADHSGMSWIFFVFFLRLHTVYISMFSNMCISVSIYCLFF
jgi:hypothetical protein